MTTTTTSRPTVAGELMRGFTRVTDPITRPLAGRRLFKLWAVVHHVGRKSGAHYATPVAIVTTPDGFIIPLPWGERTQWARNVLEAGGCQIQWGGAEYSLVDPRVIGRSEAEAFFGPVLRLGLSAFGNAGLHASAKGGVAQRPVNLPVSAPSPSARPIACATRAPQTGTRSNRAGG